MGEPNLAFQALAKPISVDKPYANISRLYMDERTGDVHFEFDDGNGNISRIAAHKSILSAASEVFDRMFYGDLKEAGDVKIEDATHPVFAVFLQSFYKEEIQLTFDNVADVWYLAKKYMMAECASACERFLLKVLTTFHQYFNVNQCTRSSEVKMSMYTINKHLAEANNNMPFAQALFNIFEWANFYSSKVLRDSCIGLIQTVGSILIETYCFWTCSRSILKEVLSIDFIHRNEWLLFDACMEWSLNVCRLSNINGACMANRRKELGDSFNLIRFDKLTAAEFLKCLAKYTEVFSQKEIKHYSKIIGAKEDEPPKKKVATHSHVLLRTNGLYVVKSKSKDQ